MSISLTNILKGRIVIVGVGNILRGDDAFGPALIERLQGQVPAVCLDSGTAPENYAGKIIKERPDTVLLVDAVHLSAEAGSWEILEKEDILKSGFSTHDLSPRMFIEYLEQQVTADIYLLAVQPKQLTMGEELSPEMSRTLTEVGDKIKEALCARDTSNSTDN